MRTVALHVSLACKATLFGVAGRKRTKPPPHPSAHSKVPS